MTYIATRGSGLLTYYGNIGGENYLRNDSTFANTGGGGGGGASQMGSNSYYNRGDWVAGIGGNGRTHNVFGIPNTNTYYSGGGGGGCGPYQYPARETGIGGGGKGGTAGSAGNNGVPNTGGGGGGGGIGSIMGSTGGSGLVILSIPKRYINIL
jgi:hypothetical protein